MSLRSYSWRSMQQRPGRTILTVLSIVIGVTAVVGINLGTATTRNAYKQMFAVVTGRATLEIDAEGGGGFDGRIFDQVAKEAGVQAATPLVDRPTSMSYGEDRRIRMEVLGIDPARDHTVRDYELVQGRQVAEGDELVLDVGFASFLSLKVGDEVRLLTKRLSKPFTIVGLFESKSGAAFTQSSIGFVPIDRAQYHFNPKGRPELIDKIQIITDPDVEPETVEPQIAKLLPPGVLVHRPASRTQLMSQTLHSGEGGLRLTTNFSLGLAAFIILNTFLMNVTERRRHLSIMRAIGATRGQITWSLIEEGIWFGVVGTAIGIVLGVGMAFIATYVLANAFQVQLPRLIEVMTPQPFLLGAAFGLAMALIGSAVPAWQAGRISPLEGMNRIVRGKTRNFTIYLLVSGTVLAGGSILMIALSILGYVHIDTAQYFALPFLIGVVLLISTVLTSQANVVAWFLKLFARVEANLALKQVLRHYLRTVLTVGVLFIAGSTGVGMANSILDNIRDVYEWYDQAIQGDYFVRAMMPDMDKGDAADLPDGLGDELKKVPHIDNLDAVAFVQATLPTSTDGSTEPLNAIAIARTMTVPDPKFDLVEGDSANIKSKLVAGEVVISSVIAQKLKLGVGDKLSMETTSGIQQIPICGVANEYMVGGLAVHMQYDRGAEWLGIEGVDGYVIRAQPEFREAMRPQLEAICKKYDVFLLSRNDIRKNVDGFVGGVEWLLWALVMMLFVVAAIGVVNTLTMNVLEQTRELGLLRIVAMTRSQVRWTILMQAIIIGCISLPSGVAMGLLMAYVLNMSMPASLGRPIDFHFYPLLLLLTLGGAFIIVLIAAYFPARRATKINVVEALHYE